MTDDRRPRAPGLIPAPLAWGLMSLVGVLWAIDVVAKILDSTHELNTTLGTAFLGVSGVAIAQARRRGDTGPDGPDGPDKAGDDEDGGGPADPPPPPPAPLPPLPPDPGPERRRSDADAIPAAELLARLRGEHSNGRRSR